MVLEMPFERAPAAVRLSMPPYGLLSLRGRPLSPAARAVCDVLRGMAGRP